MSKSKSMFHLLANEAYRIAEQENNDELAMEDIARLADALAFILANRDYADITVCQMASYVACSLGGMYEVLCELPDIRAELIEQLMTDEGYDQVDNDWMTMWIKKED